MDAHPSKSQLRKQERLARGHPAQCRSAEKRKGRDERSHAPVQKALKRVGEQEAAVEERATQVDLLEKKTVQRSQQSRAKHDELEKERGRQSRLFAKQRERLRQETAKERERLSQVRATAYRSTLAAATARRRSAIGTAPGYTRQ